MNHVLLVEDDLAIQNLLTEALQENGFSVATATCGVDMRQAMTVAPPDLVLLDLLLPEEDGRSLCKHLRVSQPGIPVIIVSALEESEDKIHCLESGADDYVTKPFNTLELIARIRALLRRTGAERLRPRAISFHGWMLKITERTLTNPEGVLVALTGVEFDLLLALCHHAGQVLSRDQLLEFTYSGQAGPVERSVDVHISRIRAKIEPGFIKTVRLGGYIFTPEVSIA